MLMPLTRGRLPLSFSFFPPVSLHSESRLAWYTFYSSVNPSCKSNDWALSKVNLTVAVVQYYLLSYIVYSIMEWLIMFQSRL